jgi:hypothetical protein
MARTALNKRRATSETSGLRHRRKTAAALVAILGAQTAFEYAVTYLLKEPMSMYDLILTDVVWIQELLGRHAT